MWAIKPFQRNLIKQSRRCFSVTSYEVQMLDMRLKRKLNVLKIMNEDDQFTYEPPEMIYDKSTGDVQILPKKIKQRKTIIRSFDDLDKEKAALFKEMGIEDGDLMKHDVAGNLQDTAEKIYRAEKQADDDFDYDPSKFFVFSRDLFRIDVGLIIMRPPIFMHMRDADIEMVRLRSEVMNEYYCNYKKYVKEFGEATQLNESILSENPYASQMNLDNYPTHEYTDPETGETMEYCAASKNFSKVDPTCTDWRSLHYAPEDRTFYLVRNKYTQEWQFPVGQMMFGETFLRGKQNLFKNICDGNWKIKYAGNLPQVHTLRDFTVAEREDTMNTHLKGVRTYFYHAHHWRGLTELDLTNEKMPYDDFAWVPKRKLNEFLTRDYHDIFADACTTR